MASMTEITHPSGQAILGVGCAALDLINEVASYPDEDAEVRALAQSRRLGGNAANTLSVLSQLGHACAWCGTIGDDPASEEILTGLRGQGIDTRPARQLSGGQAPLSCVTLSRATGSRTIVHYRDLPELAAADFARVPLAGLAWLHCEGRHPAETFHLLRDAARRRPDLPISLEIEKPRPDIERLFTGPRVLIFARAYALAQGCRDPAAFLAAQWPQTTAELLFLPWGAAGAYGQARQGTLHFAPARVPAGVVDTLGAGDVFNGALIDGLLAGLGLEALLARATALAGHKCGHQGLAGLVASARAAGWR
jgi:ketohexokinase